MRPPGCENVCVQIPVELLPHDGRFGSGPSKVRVEALRALADTGSSLMGTSHRKSPVRSLVGSVQEQLGELFQLRQDYEVVLGVGGSTAFWDIATFSLIRHRVQHLVHGEFTKKFAEATNQAPFLDPSVVIETEWNTRPEPVERDDVDAYAWAHNETSTGVMNVVTRIGHQDQLVLIDATSGAGALNVNLSNCDVYYFAPQKTLASDGGLWVAIMSPQAVERAFEIKKSRAYIPAFLDLATAIENSRQQQTYNTPAIATLFLMNHQLSWMNENGGLDWATKRSQDSASRIYEWATKTPGMQPFVPNPIERSLAVATVNTDGIDTPRLSAILRENGIVDIDAYRSLGPHQLRIATFPTVDPDDVTALLASIDYVIERLD